MSEQQSEQQSERSDKEVATHLATSSRAERQQGFVPLRQQVWVPLRQTRLPASMQDVLACNADTQRFWGKVTFRSGLFIDEKGRILTACDVTHWMPTLQLPLPRHVDCNRKIDRY